MKTKILLSAIATVTLAINASADNGSGYGSGPQEIIVNNYYLDNGYEYASRINRFHNSYVAFDFYSPLYTEVYWYSYTPYTWGVSIYDDWYYYGSYVSRYSWTNGFGGSYWWGYDPWWDYNPWMGFGWNSWYSPGISFSININLGRPHYHYPVAWNRWNYHNSCYCCGPVYSNTSNYYRGSGRGATYSSTRTYNPSHPAEVSRSSGYTVTSGRSTASRYSSPVTTTDNNQTRAGDNQGSTGNRGNQGGNAGQGGNDKDKSNNGLRMGQYRRGVAEPSEPKPNSPTRTNNPNVNDRTDPGREKTGTSAGSSASPQSQSHSSASGGRTIGQTVTRQHMQTTVRTNTKPKETTTTRGSEKATTEPKEQNVQKNSESAPKPSAEKKESGNEKGRRSSSSSSRK